MKSVRYYVLFGAYLGAIAAVVVLARALPELPGKLRGTSFSFLDIAIGIGETILVLAGIVLLGALIGWLAGWLKFHAKERARAREESLVVRR